jgi:RNA polymerase sigma factor (sigma-70 family)
MENLTDQALWNALKKGDMNAFSTLFKTFYPLLHSYGLKISNNNIALTEDCLQDFFIYIYDHRENLANLEVLKPYLYASFRRSIINAIKKSSKTVLYDDQKGLNMSFSKEDLMIKQEIDVLKEVKITKFLNELPSRQKEVLYLKYYSNLNITEIANIMEINYQSVVNMIHKSIKKLRQNASLKLLLKNII